MRRLVKFFFGAIVALAAGFSLISSSYALSKALASDQRAELLGPVVFGLISLVVLFISLRTGIRAIIPGFTFLRLIFLGLVLVIFLHLGGYVSLSSERVRGVADQIQLRLRSIIVQLEDKMPAPPKVER